MYGLLLVPLKILPNALYFPFRNFIPLSSLMWFLKLTLLFPALSTELVIELLLFLCGSRSIQLVAVCQMIQEYRIIFLGNIIIFHNYILREMNTRPFSLGNRGWSHLHSPSFVIGAEKAGLVITHITFPAFAIPWALTCSLWRLKRFLSQGLIAIRGTVSYREHQTGIWIFFSFTMEKGS